MHQLNKPHHLFAKDIVGKMAAGKQQVELHWRAGTLLIDEPLFNGGQDLGPDPFTLIIAGLVGCTLTTLRMYIRKKGWDIHDITVSANMTQQLEPSLTTIYRSIVVGDAMTDEQRRSFCTSRKTVPSRGYFKARLSLTRRCGMRPSLTITLTKKGLLLPTRRVCNLSTQNHRAGSKMRSSGWPLIFSSGR